MKIRLILFAIMAAYATIAMAEDDPDGIVTLHQSDNEKERSEIPIDVGINDKQMSIYIKENTDIAMVDICGAETSVMFDIETAAPGEVYKVDMSGFPTGYYDITIFVGDDSYIGCFEL